LFAGVLRVTEKRTLQRYTMLGYLFPYAAAGNVMRDRSITNRRSFLTNCLAGAVGLAVATSHNSSDAAEPIPQSTTSRVVVAHDPQLRDASAKVDSARDLGLLDHALQNLFGAGEPARSWGRIVHPGQRVGLKVNTLGGAGLSSSVPLVEAICLRLQQAGIRAQDIVIWDRDSAEMERAGFRIRTSGNQPQCFGTDRVGYEEDLAEFGSVGSRLSKILTQRCDVLINIPVLKDHDGAGVSMALKNMYGVIHNPNKYHPNACNPYIADVNMLPAIRSRQRLVVCDATTACYEGGPAFKPHFSWQPNALIVSQDPVALDYTGWQIIERKRAEKGLESLRAAKREPNYIATAADSDHRLGNNDPRRIVLIETRAA
jgi:uncharacterized protein (DUF362 family)